MKVSMIRTLRGFFANLLSGFSAAGMIFVLSPILLLLTGSFPEVGEHTNVELGFSLLSTLGASCCLAGLVSNAFRTLDLPLPDAFPLLWLPVAPESAPDEWMGARERVLPVVASSLVLPTLISGLGGWVEVTARAPRADARLFAA